MMPLETVLALHGQHRHRGEGVTLLRRPALGMKRCICGAAYDHVSRARARPRAGRGSRYVAAVKTASRDLCSR